MLFLLDCAYSQPPFTASTVPFKTSVGSHLFHSSLYTCPAHPLSTPVALHDLKIYSRAFQCLFQQGLPRLVEQPRSPRLLSHRAPAMPTLAVVCAFPACFCVSHLCPCGPHGLARSLSFCTQLTDLFGCLFGSHLFGDLPWLFFKLLY